MPGALSKTVLYPVIVIVGPTAVGKTDLSIRIAQCINAEIISADSRQIYKGMDIGTAKLVLIDRKGINHHFIDFISPAENFSAGEFGVAARQKILDLRKNNKNVIVVGGSGLYIRALLHGMVSFDKKNESVRQNLRQKLKAVGLPKLYLELQKTDPQLAAQLSENDTQRILRGLEVFQISGEKLSSLQKAKEIPAPFPYLQIGLHMDRVKLYQRINKRVEVMLEQDLIGEVEELIRKGFKLSNAMNAVGYKEVLLYLNNEISYQEMMEHIQRNSRRYAKRQLTWFNKDSNITWFDAEEADIMSSITKLF